MSLNQFRDQLATHQSLARWLYWIGLLAVGVGLFAALEGPMWVAVLAIALGGAALWAIFGAPVPGSSWSYYCGVSRKIREWSVHVSWQSDPPSKRRSKLASALARVTPPPSFEERHADLVAQYQEIARERKADHAVQGRRLTVAVKSVEAGRALDALATEAGTTAPAYGGQLKQAKEHAKHETERAFGEADRETERLIDYLDRRRVPSAIERNRDAVRSEVVRYRVAMRDFRDAIMAGDVEALARTDGELGDVWTSLTEALGEMHAAAAGRDPVAA